MATKNTEYVIEMDLQSSFNKMKSTLQELKLTFKEKDSETGKKITLKVRYYLQVINIEILFYSSANNTTISLTGKSDDYFGTGIIKNFNLIMSKFNNVDPENNLYTIESTSFGESINNLYQKFLGLGLFMKIFIVSTLIVLLVNVFDIGKPSICDCNTVMYYGDGSVEAAKRILDYDAGENFMSAAQRECGLQYWDEIKEWQTKKSKQLGFELQGTPADNAMEFFNEKCNSK